MMKFFLFVCHVERQLLSSYAPAVPLSLVRARATFHYTFLYKPLHFQHQSDDEDCEDYNDRLRSANIYCFRAELSAEGAKRGVETTPKVFSPDDLPRPSRQKAGLGLMKMMMMMEAGVKRYRRRSVPSNSFQLPPIDESVWPCH